MTERAAIPVAVLQRYGLQGAPGRAIGSGLINRTFLVQPAGGPAVILQRLNAVFDPAINRDIARVTAHLARRGLITPALLPARDGALWVEHGGAVWRALTYVAGVTHDRLHDARQAREAGAVLGRFHRAVRDLEIPFTNARLGVHDTARHLRALDEALRTQARHRRFEQIAPLARRIIAQAAELPALPPVPDRVVHGDPKISNIVFAEDTGRAVCLIDLDTLARMPVYLELGDAFRSWCNPRGEDVRSGGFSMALFEGAVAGYAGAAAAVTEASEWRAIVDATLTIFVELAARFCVDALKEDYFAWDPRRFGSHSEHSEVRAAGQLAAARALLEQREAAAAVVAQAFDT